MWNSFPIVLASLLIGFSFCDDSRARNNSAVNPIVATIGEENISKLHVESLYHRYVSLYDLPGKHSNHALHSVLSAYVDIKLLYLESLSQNLDKDPQNRSQFERNFPNNTTSNRFIAQLEDEILIEAFVRSHYMIDADHILFVVEDPTDMSQKRAAYDKASTARELLIRGEKQYAQMASQYSDDPYTSENGGKLSVFTVFEQIYPIESAAYQMKAGTISEPVESRFGYHILQLNSKTRIAGLKQASHILLKTDGDASKDKTVREKIWRIYSELNQDNFAQLARKYSEDYESAREGGRLGTDRLIAELELKKIDLSIGSHSEPLRTKLGWHILRIDEVVPFETFWQQRKKLKEQIELDSRIQRAVDALHAADKNTPLYRVKQHNREFYYARKMLKMFAPHLQIGVDSDLALLKAVIDSKAALDLAHLEEKFSVTIDAEVRSNLLN